MPSIDSPITIKSPAEISVMKEGGAKLGRIKTQLRDAIGVGENAQNIENLACKLIKEAGGVPSFKMVPGYHWATCINKNEGVVHGTPTKNVVFNKGDLISVDVGMYYKGYHSDTSFSLGLQPSVEVDRFLQTGAKALKQAIKAACPGNRIYDISRAIEDTITSDGYYPVKALVGHGIGKNLHEEPQIPCFTTGKREASLEIVEGMTLAIEVMYTMGETDLLVDNDGWTIKTRDAKIASLFEDSVAAAAGGSFVLTRG